MEIRNLTNADFDEVIKNEKLVLVDFWAAWCGPCKSMAPVLDKIASERDDISICKVNVDEESDLAARFKVRSIPYFALFKDGELVGQNLGAQPESSMIKFIDEHSK
ncbi:MAG: thioredoxin [Eubacteriales bacterium]|nr:thioredoxin [Eubacteriales bacterium]